jgi:hypothetical protein
VLRCFVTSPFIQVAGNSVKCCESTTHNVEALAMWLHSLNVQPQTNEINVQMFIDCFAAYKNSIKRELRIGSVLKIKDAIRQAQIA